MFTLVILTILAHFCLFLIISRHESCTAVRLPLQSQFSCSITATLFGLWFSNTSLFEFPFFLSPACHSLIFGRFFYRRNFSEFCRIHLKFLLTFQIPYLASILYVSLLHLSSSSGSLCPLLDTGWYITSPDWIYSSVVTSPIPHTQ